MSLFEFQLANVEDVIPWGEPDTPSLSWFALTDGRFRMPVGEQVLFEYTEEREAKWCLTSRDADYQVAAFARDILGSIAAAVTPLPAKFEVLAYDQSLLTLLYEQIADFDDLNYDAWRWLGERSPFTSYLVSNPRFHFLRAGDDIHIQWDNRNRLIDDLPVWSAQYGMHVMSLEAFLAECRSFSGRLLSAMDQRILGIEAEVLKPKIELEITSLRRQHEEWRIELESYFDAKYRPDIPWETAEKAIATIAAKKGVPW